MSNRKLFNDTLALISANHLMSNLAQDVLIHLYQPIIGARAVNLYLTLQSEVPRTLAHPMKHIELFDLLDSAGNPFYEQSILLEGIGLLKVYEKNDMVHGMMYLYDLQKVASPSEFLADTCLTRLLRKKIGEKRYQKLIEKYRVPKSALSGFFEVSKQFQEVFEMPAYQTFPQEKSIKELTKTFTETFGAFPERILSTEEKEAIKRSATQEEQVRLLDFTRSAFDMDFFKWACGRVRLAVKDEDVTDIIELHQLYGQNEAELANIAINASAGSNDTFVNVEKMDKLLSEKARKNEVTMRITESESEKKQRANLEKATVEWTEQGFTTQDIEGLAWSLQNSPMDMLVKIQQKLGVSAQALEDWKLKEKRKNTKLSDSMLNVLMYDLLVNRRISSLTEKNFFDRDIRDLEKKNFASMEAVLLYLKQKTAEEAIQRKQSPKKQGNKMRRVEKMPAYMQQKMQPDGSEEEAEKALKEIIQTFQEKN